ncbi:MAG: sugar ABC transporter ATP-binding protein [Eubacteriaceae bacterium]|nr:sugar ABC transporter ATP-binding protein [Eubacteriaceae bacterium]
MEPILTLENIGKQFEGNYVLKDICLELAPGEVVGLVGENGAGKSTLVKILFGMPEIFHSGGYEGSIHYNGKPVSFSSPLEAIEAGIGMVHQEFSLIPGFNASENILLNREITNNTIISKILGPKLATINQKAMDERSNASLGALGIDIDSRSVISELPVGYMQFVEIAREITRDTVKVLVFDEPTAVLTEIEAELFLEAVRKISAAGTAILFISHRLQEIMSVSDRIVVLRDGRLVADKPASELDLGRIAELMIGRPMGADKASARTGTEKAVVLKVDNLWVDMPGEFVYDVGFEVRQGEIFGIAGLAGHGKLGIANGIAGLFKAGGDVELRGTPLKLNDPMGAMKMGIAYVSEDRKGVGLVLEESIDLNIGFNAMQIQGKFLKKILNGLFSFRDEAAMSQAAGYYIKELDIKCSSGKQLVGHLSGGNQQKVCLAKAFVLEPELLFVNEPTRGIDIGAKKTVLDALRNFSETNGTSIVITSSELEELRSICDRIAVIFEGKVAGILDGGASAVEFAMLMSGL